MKRTKDLVKRAVLIIICALVYSYAGVRSSSLAAESGLPQVQLSTKVQFSYQKISNKFPVAPNKWTVLSQITNVGKGSIDVLPMYFFSEGENTENREVENWGAICPVDHKAAFGEASKWYHVIAVPLDSQGIIQQTVAMTTKQLHSPPKGQIGSYMSNQEFQRRS